MAGAIVVLNAGSSSPKFSVFVFVARGGGRQPDLRGNIEEIDRAHRRAGPHTGRPG